MPVPTTIADLSTTAASNFPAGSDSPANLDDVQRAHASFIALVRDTVGLGTGTLVPATARTNLGAAASGANSDITSLTAVTTISGTPNFTGNATGQTAAASDNDTSLATTAFVQQELTSQAVKLTGNQTVAGVKTFSSQPVLPQALTLATAQNTTSGTSIDFTSIPSWVKRVTVMLNGVSTNAAGAASILLQLGSGSVQTTGYLAYASGEANAGTTTTSVYTTGFGLLATGASSTHHGHVVFTLISGNIWICSGTANGLDGAGSLAYGRQVSGNVTLSGALDRVRLTTSNGTDTFDAGSVNILYE